MNAPCRPLPHGLQILADAAGVEAALEIAMARGGSRLYVPSDPAGSLLERLVGLDAAVLIARALGGSQIEIPQGKAALNDWLKKQGWSQERRAMRLKAARRTIQYWDAKQDLPKPMDLFD